MNKPGSWRPDISRTDSPVYLAIADAIASGIKSGTLAEGTRLPPQRTLADALGIDFTTVTRAYTEARRRNLVEGRVGHGTYVRTRSPEQAKPSEGGLIDMSMNLPPRFENQTIPTRMWKGIKELETTGGLELLLRYQVPGGTVADRTAGASWLSNIFPGLSADRVLVCAGAQGSFLAIMGHLANPDDTICVEALTYPGFRSAANHLGLHLVPVEMDQDGMQPDAFEDACRRQRPKALYCTPTLHNPTTLTMPPARRAQIARIAREHGVAIVEDDAYGMLPDRTPAPLSSFAPEISYYIASLAKCVSPALRIAYIVAPDGRAAGRLAGVIRAMAVMASPLTASVATRWLEDGTVRAVLKAIRKETSARQVIARSVLDEATLSMPPGSFHVWLHLPTLWTRGEFISRLSKSGVGAVGSDAFALSNAPEAVRLSLGAPTTRSALRHSLQTVSDLLSEHPSMSTVVV